MINRFLSANWYADESRLYRVSWATSRIRALVYLIHADPNTFVIRVADRIVDRTGNFHPVSKFLVIQSADEMKYCGTPPLPKHKNARMFKITYQDTDRFDSPVLTSGDE